jgi:hypothetical protein
LQTISRDEKAHVSFLQSALAAAGIPAVKPCTYAFPVTTVEDFVLVSGVLEGVGVTAYLGAAASIVDKLTLTAAGSILTIEARHSSLIRAAQQQDPIPQAFDVPLGFNEVFSLASQFIVECPSDNPPLPFKAFPKLALAEGVWEIKTGSKIALVPGEKVESEGLSVAFITLAGPVFVDAVFDDAYKECGRFEIVVPEGVKGQSYAVLVRGREKVSDETIVAGPVVIEIGN